MPAATAAERSGELPRSLGVRVELPRAVPAELLRPSFAWVHAADGVRVLAGGEASRLEPASAREAFATLGALSRETAIDWVEGGVLPPPPGPWTVAIAFDPDAALDASWRGFGRARFTLPSLIAWTAGDRHFAAAIGADHGRGTAEQLRGRLADLAASLTGDADAPPADTGRGDSFITYDEPDAAQLAGWRDLVSAALARIEAGSLSKVVVARAQDVDAAGAWDAGRLLQTLAARYPSCRAFLVRGDGGAHFVGATPELLCTIADRELRTEAVAGSARPDEAAQLPGRSKDLREHAWVVEHLVRRLEPLSESVSRPAEPGLRRLSNVAHLVTPISARLRAGVDAGQVVAALHPTPAVCGAPAAAALRFLAEHERVGRGLYAGLVGLVGPRRTEISVALRSALLRGPSARVFAGAGLVQGSDAAAELRETGLKMAALLQALAECAPPGGAR